MRVACVNADRGIAPGAHKGAAVHVEAMRRAFQATGADVLPLDVSDEVELRARLESEHVRAPLDLVYERHALGAYVASEFARARDVPHVLEVNAPLALEEARHRPDRSTPIDAARERAALRCAARVLCVSAEVRHYAVERGARPERARVEPNAVDPELFRPRAPDDPLRAQLVPGGRVALGFHGRLRPWHRFDRLALACQRLLAEGLPIHLVLLGEGDFDAGLVGRVPAERVTRRAWLPHADAARVVASMDVLPLCYAPDEPCYFSPLKLREAMACAAVPVVPGLGDLADAVRHDVDGLVYDARAELGLEQALRRLILDEPLRQRLGGAARARAVERTWVAIAAELLGSIPARRTA